MTVIDIHSHFVPQDFPAPPSGVPESEWPVMQAMDDGRAQMVIGGEPFRVFDTAYWDVAGRLEFMDREGIDFQLLSPLPELLGYWFAPETTEALARHMHAQMAAAIASAPDRLAGIGMVPLQDVPRAVAMLEEISGLGFKGVLVASNVNGMSLADSRFDPFFAGAAEIGLPVLVHGYKPAGTERFVGSPLLAPIVGPPQDITALIASLIITDILGRFRDLKLVFLHGGGGFGSVLDRMDHVWRKFPDMQEKVAVAPRDYVRRFWYDTVTFSEEYLAYLIGAFGLETIMAGSDGPTPLGQLGMSDFVRGACHGDEDSAGQILGANAIALFGLDEMLGGEQPRRHPRAAERTDA